MVSVDFVNHLNPNCVKFSSAFLKTVQLDSAANKKSENINIMKLCYCATVFQEILEKLCYA